MTNYNERIDETLEKFEQHIRNHSRLNKKPELSADEAKQAIRKLVADEMLELLKDESLMDAEILHTTGYTDDEGVLHICKCNADYSDARRKITYNECRAYLRTKLAEWLNQPTINQTTSVSRNGEDSKSTNGEEK